MARMAVIVFGVGGLIPGRRIRENRLFHLLKLAYLYNWKVSSESKSAEVPKIVIFQIFLSEPSVDLKWLLDI